MSSRREFLMNKEEELRRLNEALEMQFQASNLKISEPYSVVGFSENKDDENEENYEENEENFEKEEKADEYYQKDLENNEELENPENYDEDIYG